VKGKLWNTILIFSCNIHLLYFNIVIYSLVFYLVLAYATPVFIHLRSQLLEEGPF